MKHTAIYIRKSREDKDKPSHRLIVQREQLPAYATAQGWLYTIYDDGHASAARGKTDDLKERSRLEADIHAGTIERIICIELSRLSRDDSLQDYVAWLHLCAERGVKLATLSRSLDPSQHSDWMLLLMEGGFSSVEMKVLKGRMKEGHDQAWRAGKFMGGTPPPPYIYDHAAGRPVIDPRQLSRMRKLWQMAETTSAKKIAETLGMPEIAVRRALADERLEFYQAKRKDPATGEIIICDWDPCINAEQALRIRSGRRSRKPPDSKAAFGGLLSAMQILYCGHCDFTAKVWHNSKTRADGSRIDYYGCRSRGTRDKCPQSRLIRQDVADPIVIEVFCDTMENMETIQELWRNERENSDKGGELEDVLTRLQADEARKKRLVNAIAEGIIDFADARKQITEITGRIETLQKQRQELMMNEMTPAWEELQMTREEFNSLTVIEQRAILQLAIKRIRLYHHRIEITFHFPIASNGARSRSIELPKQKTPPS
jgi:DNA invertase Pin-like site-specific DNA recombinase